MRIFVIGLLWPIGEFIRAVGIAFLVYVTDVLFPYPGGTGPLFEWTPDYFLVMPGLVVAGWMTGGLLLTLLRPSTARPVRIATILSCLVAAPISAWVDWFGLLIAPVRAGDVLSVTFAGVTAFLAGAIIILVGYGIGIVINRITGSHGRATPSGGEFSA